MSDFYDDSECVSMPLNGKKPIVRDWQSLVKSVDWDGHNRGIVCGSASGCTVVDIDTDDDGLYAWELIQQLIPDLDTAVVKTPSGGFHYYYQYEKDLRTSSKCVTINGKKVGIDIRNDKGQVVAAGSIYQSDKPNKTQYNGLRYEWLECPYISGGFAEMPRDLKWLLEGFYTIITDEHGPRFVHKDHQRTALRTEAKEHDIDLEKFKRAVMGLGPTRYDSRDDWLNVIFAIGDTANKTGEDLSDLAIEFSQQSDKYSSEGDVLEKYNRSGGGITAGTVYHMLKQDNKALYDELTGTQQTNMLDPSMLDMVNKMFEDKIKQEPEPEPDQPQKPPLEYYHDAEHIIADRYTEQEIYVWVRKCLFKVTESGHTRWVVKDIDPFTNMPKLTILENIPYWQKDDARKVKLQGCDQPKELWKMIRDYSNSAGIAYKTMDCLPYFHEADKQTIPNVLNTWMGYPHIYTKQEYKAPPANIKHWIDHFLFMCDNDDTLVKWIAHMIQKPHMKSFNILMEGGKGVGKTLCAEAICRMFGSQLATMINNLDNICGTFNSILEGKQFININECVSFTKARDENVLKSLTTETRIIINRKNQSQYQTNFYGRFLITVNSRFGIRISEDDRRNYCISVNPAHRGDKTYFKPMVDDINSNNPQVWHDLFNYLANLDISDFDHTRPKMTSFKKILIKESIDPLIDYLGEVASSQRMSICMDEKAEVVCVRTDTLYADYKDYMAEQGESAKRVKKKKMFIATLEEMGFKYGVHRDGESRIRGFKFKKADMNKASHGGV